MPEDICKAIPAIEQKGAEIKILLIEIRWEEKQYYFYNGFNVLVIKEGEMGDKGNGQKFFLNKKLLDLFTERL